MREWSSHSYEKISILGDYLRAFAKASQSAPERAYIDAFAATPRMSCVQQASHSWGLRAWL